MANPYQGLFSGQGVNSLGGVQQTMMREKNQRIANAMAQNAAAGGNYYSNLIAKSNAQLGEAAKGMMQGLAGGSLGNVGAKVGPHPIIKGTEEGFLRQALPQDPRLSQAMKRDTDRREILSELGKFTEEGSDGGSMMTEVEMRKGHAMLLERGYVDEAAKFLAQAQNEVTIAAKKNNALAALQKQANPDDKLKFEGPVVKDKNGNVWQTASTENGKITRMLLTGDPKATFNPDGAIVINPNEVGKLQANTSNDYIKSGVSARESLPQAEELLRLAKTLTGGGAAASLKEAARFFGVDRMDAAKFRTESQMYLVKNLKAIMGARPTDKDMEELKDALNGESKTVAENVAILTKTIERLKKESLAGDYFAKNPAATLATFNNHQKLQEMERKKKAAAGVVVGPPQSWEDLTK